VSADVLRVWERRYGLLTPQRSPGGFRLYSPRDEARVRAMRRHMAEGMTARTAARLALREDLAPAAAPAGEAPLELGRAVHELGVPLEAFDDTGSHRVLDRLLATFTVETVVRDVILPYLRLLGDRWEAGEVSVAQEHFASEVLHGRLMGLARGWGAGTGLHALLACPPDELHDLGLLCFGVGLKERGWRITFLGADTPIDTLRDAADQLAPDLVVICAERLEPLGPVIPQIALLAARHRVALAGRGATAEHARAAGAELLQDAPIAAAARIAGEAGSV
jgi:DNA-binding transcriptional MerR regulator